MADDLASSLSVLNAASAVLPPRPRSVAQKIIALPYDVARCPSVLLGVGNCFYTWPHDRFGFCISVGQTMAAGLCAAYESWTGIHKGLPAYAVAAVNLFTSISYFSGINVADLQALNKETVNNLYSATSFFLWTAANTFRGLRDGKHIKDSRVFNNEMTYFGIGDISAVHDHWWAAIPFALGLTKIVLKPSTPSEGAPSLWRKTANYLTPRRLYGFGYAGSSLVTAISNPFSGIAQGLWSVFYFRVTDPEQNSQPNTSVISGPQLG